MPIYEYQCLRCGRTVEVQQKFSDPPKSRCPHCRGKLKRLISNTTFILKGSGWYKTDYATKAEKEKKDDEKREKKPDADKKEEADSDTKEKASGKDSNDIKAA